MSLEHRRGFLTAITNGLLGAIAAAFGVPSVLYLTGRPKQQRSRWVDAGDVSTLPSGTPKELTFRRNRVDGWKIRSEKETAWVLKSGDSLTAFSPWCTHLGCAYRWDGRRSRFECPCHGSAFAKNGAVIEGPAPRPLDRYEVKVEGARLWIGALGKQEQS